MQNQRLGRVALAGERRSNKAPAKTLEVSCIYYLYLIIRSSSQAVLTSLLLSALATSSLHLAPGHLFTDGSLDLGHPRFQVYFLSSQRF